MSNKTAIFCDRIIEFCLYLLIFFLPFAKAGMQIFTWFAILAWIIKKIAGNKNKKSILLPKNINTLLLFFLISCTISTVLSFNFALALKALLTKTGKQLLLFLIVIETINTNKRFRNILLVFVVSAVLIMTDAGAQYFVGKDFLRGYVILPGYRLQASFSNAVGFSGWLITIIPILLILIFSKLFFRKKIYKAGFFILLFILIICLCLTYARSAWLGFILSLILISCFFLKKLKMKPKVLASLLIIVILYGAVTHMPLSIKERLFSISAMEGSIPLRINLWKDSLRLIGDFPFFGIGLNNYSEIMVFYRSTKDNLYPHNSYLQMVSEIGIIGLLSFLGIILTVFKSGSEMIGKTGDKLLLGLMASLSAFLVQSFFDSNLYALQLVTLFWLIMGLTVARVKLLESEKVTPT